MNNRILIISGPTASGKTSLSIELAKRYNGEILNFDSLLFYKELNIGTAKPTLEERSGIPHHMIDIASAKNPINAASYIKLALPLVESILHSKKLLILVGGSGFYLQALIYGMFDSITTPREIIDRSNKLYGEKGISPFLEILKENDFKTYKRLHENDHYRIRRAVEHFWTTGNPISGSKEEMEERRKKPLYEQKGWNLFHIYLDMPKEEHFKIIEKRTKLMFDSGLIKETEELLRVGFTGLEKPLQSIGYKEAQHFLRNENYTQEALMTDISIATRQLAKAQRTWFKKWEKNTFHPIEERDKIFLAVEKFIYDRT